jgi:hypothetical protein
MVRRGSFIGGQDNLSVPDAPTIGTATAGNAEVSVAFTAPSAVGDDPITSFGVSVFPATGTTKTFRVTVASGNLYGGGTGNVFYIDGVGNPKLTLVKGFTYVFDQEDSSNSGHPFHFKNSSDSQYTTGVTVTGTAGQSGAKVTLVLAEDASEPSAYYCTAHGNGMGNTITLVAPSASDDPLGQAQYSNTGSSSPITVTGLSNGTSYVAKVWAINDYGNGPLSDATSSFSPVAPTGLFFGGEPSNGSYVNAIEKITISSASNSTDFGDLSSAKYQGGACSSSTRALYGGGYGSSGGLNVIEYVTFSSAGNATDFGDLSITNYGIMSLSSSTRGIFAGGQNDFGTAKNLIEYVTIASTGNVTDFGDLTVTKKLGATAASTTRGVFYGGDTNVIDYITIASTGNATDFGDASINNDKLAGASNSTTGVFAGNSQSDGTIYKITIASTGNDTSFGGSLSESRTHLGATSSSARAVFGGGINNSDVRTDTMDFITYSSAGNAVDFGNLISAKGYYPKATSNSHGGIS